MNVNYCDLCGNPIKQEQIWILYVLEPINANVKFDYLECVKEIENKKKEICSNCKYLFDKIFEYRLDRMNKLTEECQELFNLSTNKNTYKKNAKKKKK